MSDALQQANNGKALPEVWKAKFDLLEKLGAGDLGFMKTMSGEGFKALSFSDRRKVQFNLWALVFACFYYFAKGMWHRGAFILGASWLYSSVLVVLESAIGMALPSVVYWIVPAVFCAQSANYDYYRHVSKQDRIWSWLPNVFSKTLTSVLFPVICASILMITSMFAAGGFQTTCSSEDVKATVIDIALQEWRKKVSVSDEVTLELSDIRTVAQNESLSCAANLNVHSSVIGPYKAPLTYLVQPADDGGYYVNVFGL